MCINVVHECALGRYTMYLCMCMCTSVYICVCVCLCLCLQTDPSINHTRSYVARCFAAAQAKVNCAKTP